MKSISEINNALNTIRGVLDIDVVDSDIQNVQNKVMALTQLMGLSAETLASVKKIMHLKELEAFKDVEKLQPSLAMRKLKAICNDEIAVLEYADRLNAGIVHSIDAMRSIISLYKTEMTNSMKQ